MDFKTETAQELFEKTNEIYEQYQQSNKTFEQVKTEVRNLWETKSIKDTVEVYMFVMKDYLSSFHMCPCSPADNTQRFGKWLYDTVVDLVIEAAKKI